MSPPDPDRGGVPGPVPDDPAGEVDGPAPTPGTAPTPAAPAVPAVGSGDPARQGGRPRLGHYSEVPTSPYLLRMAAGWSWRVLVVATAVYLLLLLLVRLRIAVGAFIGALLLAALLVPVVHLLRRLRLPDALAALLGVLGLVAVVAGAAALLGTGIAGQFDTLRDSVTQGIDQLTEYAQSLGVDAEQVTSLQQQAREAVTTSSGRLASGALTATTVAAEVLSATVLALFTLFFFLKDGQQMWAWVVRLFAARLRGQVDQAGQRAWAALTGYMRGIVVIALADALLVALALYLLGVPLVLPLALITFLGAFVPIVGAFVSGFLASLVALVFNDLPTALLVLGAFVLVQQIEGNLLHPVVMRRAVSLHPLVTVVAVTAGATLAGIAGAIVSVPLAALVNVVVVYLSGQATLVRRSLAGIEASGHPAEPAYPVLALLSPGDQPGGHGTDRPAPQEHAAAEPA